MSYERLLVESTSSLMEYASFHFFLAPCDGTITWVEAEVVQVGSVPVVLEVTVEYMWGKGDWIVVSTPANDYYGGAVGRTALSISLAAGDRVGLVVTNTGADTGEEIGTAAMGLRGVIHFEPDPPIEE